MTLIWAKLSEQGEKEAIDLVQKREAIETMLAKIAMEQSEYEGIWRNSRARLASELTLINTRLGQIRQPTKVE